MSKENKEREEGVVEGLVDEVLPGMGELLKRMKKTSPEIKRRVEEAEREIKDRLKKGYSPKPKIEYGFSIRTLVREEEKKGLGEKDEISEPLVDVFDEKNYTKVIVELPGVNEDDINVNLRERKIIIDAATEGRRYHKVIELPHDVKDMKKRYKNGILELEAVKNGT